MPGRCRRRQGARVAVNKRRCPVSNPSVTGGRRSASPGGMRAGNPQHPADPLPRDQAVVCAVRRPIRKSGSSRLTIIRFMRKSSVPAKLRGPVRGNCPAQPVRAPYCLRPDVVSTVRAKTSRTRFARNGVAGRSVAGMQVLVMRVRQCERIWRSALTRRVRVKAYRDSREEKLNPLGCPL